MVMPLALRDLTHKLSLFLITVLAMGVFRKLADEVSFFIIAGITVLMLFLIAYKFL